MTLTRRQFGVAVAAVVSAAGATSLAEDQEQKPLRVIAYNIYKCTG